MILPRRLITSWGKMELITNLETFLSLAKIDSSFKMIQNKFLTPLANAIIPQSVAKRYVSRKLNDIEDFFLRAWSSQLYHKFHNTTKILLSFNEKNPQEGSLEPDVDPNKQIITLECSQLVKSCLKDTFSKDNSSSSSFLLDASNCDYQIKESSDKVLLPSNKLQVTSLTNTHIQLCFIYSIAEKCLIDSENSLILFSSLPFPMTTTKPFILYLKLSKDNHLKKDLCVLKTFNYADSSNEKQSHNNTANNSCWFALSITRNNANFHRSLWQFTFISSLIPHFSSPFVPEAVFHFESGKYFICKFVSQPRGGCPMDKSSFVIDSMSLCKKTEYDLNWKDYLHLLITNNQTYVVKKKKEKSKTKKWKILFVVMLFCAKMLKSKNKAKLIKLIQK